jgi:hypothetical protein
MRSLVTLALVCLSVVAVSAQSPTDDTRSWQVYRDDANGISFRYPPNLKVVKPSLEHMHVRGLLSIVKLLPTHDPKPDRPVLTMTVFACGEPGLPCLDEAWFRRVCHNFEAFPLGNARAFQCVDFGSAGCHWKAQVNRDRLRIGIGAPSAEHEINGRTHERAECAEGVTKIRTLAPIDGILASFVFDK